MARANDYLRVYGFGGVVGCRVKARKYFLLGGWIITPQFRGKSKLFVCRLVLACSPGMRVDCRSSALAVVLIVGTASLLHGRYVPALLPFCRTVPASHCGPNAVHSRLTCNGFLFRQQHGGVVDGQPATGTRLQAILTGAPHQDSRAISTDLQDDLVAARASIAELQKEVAKLKNAAVTTSNAHAWNSPPSPPPDAGAEAGAGAGAGAQAPDPPAPSGVDGEPKPRCTRNGCDFEFPGPVVTYPERPDQLPTFPDSCLLP